MTRHAADIAMYRSQIDAAHTLLLGAEDLYIRLLDDDAPVHMLRDLCSMLEDQASSLRIMSDGIQHWDPDATKQQRRHEPKARPS